MTAPPIPTPLGVMAPLLAKAKTGDVPARLDAMDAALQLIAAGYVPRPYGQKSMQRGEAREIARATCEAVGLDYDRRRVFATLYEIKGAQ